MLYLIGTGLYNEKDLSLRAVEALKKCENVYLEGYTSVLDINKDNFKQLTGKEIKIVYREYIEKKFDNILEENKDKDFAIMIIGDPLAATTHTDLLIRCKEKEIPFKIIHNTTILTAIGECGLQLYKYGKTTSIPFTINTDPILAPVNVIKENLEKGMHTLALLDLDPKNDKFLTPKETLQYLLKNNAFKEEKTIICCSRIGWDDQKIVWGKAIDLSNYEFGKAPFCVVIPGAMHFMEEEFLEKMFEEV